MIAPMNEMIAPGPMMGGAPVIEMGPAVDTSGIEQALVNVMRGGHERARALNEEEKEKWRTYRLLSMGINVDEDPADPLGPLSIYRPMLARHIDSMTAQAMQDLMPRDLDFFEFISKIPDAAPMMEAIKGLMLNKVRSMRPDGCDGGFPDFVEREWRNSLAYGNCFSLTAHEALAGDKPDGFRAGPKQNPISPFNIFPWRNDVTSYAQTAATIYDPISEDDLLEITLNGAPMYQGAAEVLAETEPRGSVTMLEQTGAGQLAMDPGGQVTELLERIIYIGPWPRAALRRGMGEETYDEMGVLEALSMKFGFDPALAAGARWWCIQWIGQRVIYCRPYPITLPGGAGPIKHYALHRVPGLLHGLGLYDLNSWTERLYNYFERCRFIAAGMVANPPWVLRKFMIEQEWLMQRGDAVSLEPGDVIPQSMGQFNMPPVEPLPMNERSLPLLTEVNAGLENGMREQTGATYALEGQDSSGTATQSANNLAQSQGLIHFYEWRFEQEYLKDIVRRLYMCLSQAMQSGAQIESAPVTYEMMAIGTTPIYPEHLIAENFIEIVMTGLNQISNRMMESQILDAKITRWLPLGMMDPVETFKRDMKTLPMSGTEKLVMNWQNADVQKRFYSLMAMFQNGKGAQLMDPMAFQGVTGMPMAPMGGPPGAGGETGSSGGAGGAGTPAFQGPAGMTENGYPGAPPPPAPVGPTGTPMYAG